MRSIGDPWKEVSLGEICEFKYGRSLPESAREGGPIPVFGSNGIVGHHDQSVTNGPTIVIGRKGSFGEVNFSDIPCWPIDTTYYVDESSTTADLRWLSYRLSALGLTRLNRAAAIPGLNREDAYRQRLLYPPPAEQRRIAAILDKADELRVKRRAALKQFDGFVQAMFFACFGDPVINPHGLPKLPLERLCRTPEDIRCGPFGTQLGKNEVRSEGVALWGIKNVNTGFRLPTKEFLDVRTARRLEQYSLEPGDIVMTRKGTVGNCAVYPADFVPGIMHSDLLRIRVYRQICDPVFLSHQLHYSGDVAKQLKMISGGAVMPGINVTRLKELKVLAPPRALQREFSGRTEAVERLKAAHTASLSAMDTLFASLQYRAFVGEL